MTIDNQKREILQSSIENIVFREKDFEKLNHIINKLYKDKANLAEAKEKIATEFIQFRLRIIKNLFTFIKFHFKQDPESQKIENLPDYSKLKKDLEERDEFLEIIGRKIETIYKKLAEKHTK